MAKECFFVAYGGHWITLKKSEKWAYSEKKFSEFLDAFDFFKQHQHQNISGIFRKMALKARLQTRESRNF